MIIIAGQNKKKTNSDLDNIRTLETEKISLIRQSRHALMFHLMPPVGWMNDPNGLCQLNGTYHIFFQYSPYDAKGSYKYWGHYETQDFLNFTYTGIFLSPDSPLDKDGVYSGSAYTEHDLMYLYYTGNTKEDGEHDFIYEGRGSNTILVTSKDGIHPSRKECLLTSNDYPEMLSCHVRDPKVWKENDLYYLILGGRTKEDYGCTLLYESTDLKNWTFTRLITSEKPFGYMWECPDVLQLSGHRFLSISPQGVQSEDLRYQNIYQSGYFHVTGPLSDLMLNEFTEWDMGFDFYAPQTFEDESGRRILIGWMGIPDAEYTNPTIQDGWQHALTLPRELSLSKDGKTILQQPIRETESLRSGCIYSKTPNELMTHDKGEKSHEFNASETVELLFSSAHKQDFLITLDRSMLLQYDHKNSLFTLSFLPDEECNGCDAKGYGRSIRKVPIQSPNGIHHLRIFLDRSSIEIFINSGEYVLTSRYYRDDPDQKHHISFSGISNVEAFALNPYQYQFTKDDIQ